MNKVYNIYYGFDFGELIATAPTMAAAVAFIKAQDEPDDYCFEQAGAEC